MILVTTNDVLELPLEGRVESVLDMVVSSPRKIFGNLRPLVAKLLMSLNYFPIFLRSPLILLNIWIKMIVPSLATLLADPTR